MPWNPGERCGETACRRTSAFLACKPWRRPWRKTTRDCCKGRRRVRLHSNASKTGRSRVPVLSASAAGSATGWRPWAMWKHTFAKCASSAIKPSGNLPLVVGFLTGLTTRRERPCGKTCCWKSTSRLLDGRQSQAKLRGNKCTTTKAGRSWSNGGPW